MYTKLTNHKLNLKAIEVTENEFAKILDFTKRTTVYMDCLVPYLKGYPNKMTVYHTDNELIVNLIVLEHLNIIHTGFEEAKQLWYQVHCICCDHVNTEARKLDDNKDVGTAIKHMNKVIAKHYTEDEKEEIFHNHENDKSDILHFISTLPDNKIVKFENAYYYDINSAYGSLLSEMFPKCANDFEYMFKHRHDNNNKFKNCFNYYVGCLTQNEAKREAFIKAGFTPRKIYPKTRHYIINRITKMVSDRLDKLDAMPLYVNTDGLIVQNPLKVFDHSDKIGEFKLEYQGPVYMYHHTDDKCTYTIIQYGDEIKGTAPNEIRKLIDLRQGKSAVYETEYINNVRKIKNTETIENIEIEIRK